MMRNHGYMSQALSLAQADTSLVVMRAVNFTSMPMFSEKLSPVIVAEYIKKEPVQAETIYLITLS